MNILILNWRDIKNPLSGGAEILTHEMAKGYVRNGHSVTWFCSCFPGSKTEEVIDGVRFIRKGNPDVRSLVNSVHVQAFFFYKKFMEGRVDVVIDEIHGLPFFTPLYVREKKVAFICEVAKDIWDKMFPFPWNIAGKTIEKLYFFFYKRVAFLTISNSTKKDLIDFGVQKKYITVMPMGINRVTLKKFKKEKDPTLIFVGRINKMKGIEDVIDAFRIFSTRFKQAKLWIVGSGLTEYTKFLKKKIKKFKINERVVFWGFVKEKKKFELMAKAWIIVVASIREGFGLIVPEANSVGTPAVVYDVPGLRDLVKDKINGVKVNKNTPAELANAFTLLIGKKREYWNISKLAKQTSKVYNWEDTVRVSLKVLTSK